MSQLQPALELNPTPVVVKSRWHLPGWLELWMFRRVDDGWVVDIVPPNTDGPDLGYVELAGFSSDGKHAVIARESRTDGAVHRSFESVVVGTLAVDKQASQVTRADEPELL